MKEFIDNQFVANAIVCQRIRYLLKSVRKQTIQIIDFIDVPR